MIECPECKAKILWGLANPEQMEGVDVEPGDVVVAGCLLGEAAGASARSCSPPRRTNGGLLSARSAMWGW